MVSSTERPAQRKRGIDRVPTTVLATIAIALFVGAGVGAALLGQRGDVAQEDNATTKSQLRDAEQKVDTGVQLAGANLEFCIDPAVLAVLQKGGYDEVCKLAVVVQTEGKRGEAGQPGARGPGPTSEQIGAAVEQYFADHPLPEGKEPTIAQVATAVGDYLRTNPPEPGRPPTPEEVASATAAYLASNIEAFRGEPGKTGEQGPPPSAEDVRAAVNAYCAENSRCRGEQGPQGVGITGTMLTRDSQGVCTLYFNHENPANGQVTQSFVQVNDEMCEPVTPDPTPPTGRG